MDSVRSGPFGQIFRPDNFVFGKLNSAVSSLNYLTRGVLSMKNLLAQKTSFALHFAAAPVFCGHIKLQLLLPIQHVNISAKHKLISKTLYGQEKMT